MSTKIIPLMERDGRETYFHGAVVVPDQRTSEQVIQDLKRLYGEVIGSSDEWTYDDIFARLRREGYTLLEHDEVFWEDEADPICLPAAPVQAEVHSDDHKAAASFDARLWFEQATDEDIRELAGIGWGGDYEADAVARYMEDRNEDVAGVFTYARTAALGFECHVDEASALAYLAIRRPALHAELTTT